MTRDFFLQRSEGGREGCVASSPMMMTEVFPLCECPSLPLHADCYVDVGYAGKHGGVASDIIKS